MTITKTVSEYTGVVPDRSQPESEFETNVPIFLNYMDGLAVDINEWSSQVNTTQGEINTTQANIGSYIDAAVSDAESAATQAQGYVSDSQAFSIQSLDYANGAKNYLELCQSVANYVGLWSEQTGPLNKPATVFHADSFWALNVDLVDVAASEPADNNTDWQRISLFQTEEPVLAPETLSVNEESSGSVSITNYNADLEYTAESLDTNIATVSLSGGLLTVNGLDITDATNKTVQVRVTAKASGIPVSNPAVLDVTVVYVPVADDGTIQVVDFSAEAEFNDGFDQV